MRTSLSIPGILLVLALTGACNKRPEVEYHLTATVRDLMNATIDPSADVVWESVATIETKAGTEKKAPHTDQEWAHLRYQALQLAEAANLLQMPGRHVAGTGEKNEQGIELQPEEIEALINRDRAAWINFCHGLQDAAGQALQAIDAKNLDGIQDAGLKIDTACENCHVKYWYPPTTNQTASARNRHGRAGAPI